MTKLHRTSENETCLRHRSFRRVNEQKNAVHHFKNTLDLAAEIGVAGGINNVYLYAVAYYGCVFRKDRDAALALKIAGVHDSLAHDLILVILSALLQHFIHESSLAMVNVGDNRYIFQIFTYQKNYSASLMDCGK